MPLQQTGRSGFWVQGSGQLPRAPSPEPRASFTVDVRDMLCAQALAVVARAMGRLSVGRALEVTHDAEDVRRDVTLWAKERGHTVQAVSARTLWIVRR